MCAENLNQSDEPSVSLLAALRAELRDYEAERDAFAARRGVDAEHRAGVLRMWAHAIGVKRAQVEREEGKG